jgi:pimeloyl-ACP methyl ester carboxylesterase
MFLSFERGKIHYSDSGSGTVIVLLHGYLESSEVWESFSKKLADEFRVIAVDLPGHGLSDVYGETHKMEFMAKAVKELLVSLQIDKVILAGHSMGGYVTIAFADLYPEYLSAYCLFHSQPFSDPPVVLEKRRREIEMVRSGNKNLMYPDNIVRMFAPSNLAVFQAALQRSMDIASNISGEGIIAVLNGMMVRPSRVHIIEEGKVPCLWILGLMDNYIPCDAIQEKVRLPLNAKVVVLKNSGHMGFIEEEDLSVKILSDFLTGIL